MKPIIAAALILSASAAHAETTTKTVSWYVAHPEARAKVYALCQDNPGEAQHNANCLNAVEALSRVSAQEADTHLKAAQAGHSVLDCGGGMGWLYEYVNHCPRK